MRSINFLVSSKFFQLVKEAIVYEPRITLFKTRSTFLEKRNFSFLKLCTKELVFHLRACFRTFHATEFSLVGLFYCFLSNK